MTCWERGDACPDCGEPADCAVLCEYVDQGVVQRWYGKGCTRHEAAA